MSQNPARQAEYEKADKRMETKIKKQCETRNNATTWVLMTPALIFMLAFTVLPIFRSLCLSFFKYKLGMDSVEFIDLENYVKLAGSKLLWKVMKSTIVFALMTVIPSMAMGLGLVALVSRKGKGVRFIRMTYFYPMVMSMIAVASVWMFIYVVKDGLFDQLLIAVGLEPMSVLSNKNAMLPAMAVMYVQREVRYLMVFFLSGIQSISDEVMEAARVDGVDSWTVFRYTTIPLLTSTFLFAPAIALANCFKLVDHMIIMTEGAPNNASILLLYYIYQQGFTSFNYGILSALTVIMPGLLLVVPLPRLINQDKKIHYN